jgi:GMP synthase (glutamine-hydrolyzing) (EC 6.3.5.2)
MAKMLGGNVVAAEKREYGRTETEFDNSCVLFEGLDKVSITWMSHSDYIKDLPEGFTVSAWSKGCPVAAIQNPDKKFYGVQFHPEVNHTQNGKKMLHNFLYKVCGCTGDWSMGNYAKTTIEDLRKRIGNGKVLLALSGGVDSSVTAALLSKAVGKNLTCIFVDHGLMRKNEGDEIEAVFGNRGINFIRVMRKSASSIS